MVDYNLDYGKSNPIAEFQAGYEGAQRIRAGNQKIRTNDIKNDDNQLALAQKKLAATHDLLKGVTPENYVQRLQIGINSGIISPEDIQSGKIPQQYDQNTIDAWNGMLINSKDAIDNAYKQAQIKYMQVGGSAGVLADRSNDPAFVKNLANVKLMTQGMSGSDEGGVQPLPGYNEAKAGTKGAEKTAEKTSEADVARQAGKTKVESALQGFKQQSNLVTKNIDDALDLVKGGNATGWMSFASSLPNSDAGKLRNTLDTIKANVGFDKLQQMRESSPTGGALGQVSDMENRLLQAVNGALDPKQETQLIQNLKVIKELYPQILTEKQRAFDQDYGNVKPLGNNPQPLVESPYAPEEAFNRSVESTDPYQKAREAIAAGKSRAAVEKRLLDNGLDPRRLNQ